MTFGPEEENQILRHFLKRNSYDAPGNLLLTLGTGIPGAELDSNKNPGYAPIPVTYDLWGFATQGRISNILTVTFPVAITDWEEQVGAWLLWSIDTSFQVAAGRVDNPMFIKEWERVVFEPFTMSIIQNGREPNIWGHFSDFAENAIMNHVLGKVTYPAPDIWVGLCTANPGDAGTNENCNEVSPTAGGYQRVSTSPAGWDVTAFPYWGRGWNNARIEFPDATLNGWGRVTHVALFDVQFPTDDGHLLIYGPLETPWTVTAGSKPWFEGASYLESEDKGMYVRFSV